MKKLIALLLTILALTSLVSCQGNETKPQENTVAESVTETEAPQTEPSVSETDTEVPGASLLKGRWICPISVETTLIINGHSLEELLSGFTVEQIGCDSTMNVYLDFNTDGTATFTQKGDELDTLMLEFYSDFYTYLSDYDIACEFYGMDRANLDNNAHEEYGVSTWPEAMQVIINNMKSRAQENPTDDAISDINYTVSDNTVTLTYTADSSTEIYTIDGNTLTCIESDNFSGDPSKFTYTKEGIESLLEGEWRAETNFLDTFNYSGMNAEGYFNQQLSPYGITIDNLGISVPDTLPITYIITFTDGKAINGAQATEYFEFLNTFYDAFADYISDPVIFAEKFYEGGLAELESLAEEADMTVEEFMADEIEYIRNTDETMAANLAESNTEGSYTVNGNTVTVTSDIDSIEYEYVDGNLITPGNLQDLVFIKQ